MTCKDCAYARIFGDDSIMQCRNHWEFCTLDAVICNEFKPKKIEGATSDASTSKYVLKGNCNICANRDLPLNSSTCVECGLSRKNYKPM